MKSKLTFLLLTGLFAYGSRCTLHAQTDVTDTYLKNPSFENQFTDWDHAGMQTQTNASFPQKEGNTYIESWVGQGNKVADAHVSQTVTPLKNGVYKITVAAQNIQQNSSVIQSGAYIFAGNASKEVNATGEYSLTFTVIEGEATIGFRAQNATGNWIACDNFRLYAVNNDLINIQEEMKRRIEDARTLLTEKMQKGVATELNAAILSAQQEAEAATDENMADAALRLNKAVTEAQKSIEAYGGLQAAIEKALAAYGEGDKEGATDFDNAIKKAQNVAENQEADATELALEVSALESATLAFAIANATGTAPTVVTDTRYARGATMAFGRSTVTGVAASDLMEQGFCWSTSPTPTVLDNRTTEYLNNNGRIYRINNLTPSTVYYMRAYAMTKEYAVGYGKVIKIITIPKGTIGWSYDNKADAEANARINAAISSAVEYWNNLTSIKGLHLDVHFGSSTPTADCSYGGWMRVGPNASYQRTGTIMHEMGHAIGVGQHGVWYNGDSPLRANGGRGDWLGDRANAVLRFWDNNPSAVMTGDNTHMWPYGINGAHEDNGSEMLYIANGLITQALGEDGLPPTGGFSTPAYVFEQEDNVKYYLKNESANNGLYSSYLVATEGSTALNCMEMSAEEAMSNDCAAWYVTFNPKTSYYQFRNAGTGQYISYNASRNKFVTANKTTPVATESFHRMRGRTDGKIGSDNGTFNTRGYWIVYPDGTASPNCMTTSATGRVSTDVFNLNNSAEAQRWVILEQEELTPFNTALKAELNSQLNEMLTRIKELAATPHTEDTAGADDALSSALSDIEEKSKTPEITSTEISVLTEEARAAGMAFLDEATPISAERPFDITFLLSDAELTDAKGWNYVPSISYSCGEFFQRVFDFNQIIKKMPAGTYQFKGQAFQRPGTATEAYKAFVAGQDNVNTVIYAATDESKLKSIAAEAQTKRLGGEETVVSNSPTRYVPSNMEAASKYFAAGLYDNGVITQLTKSGSNLKVGLRCSEAKDNYWCIFDNFRLYFYGTMSKEIVSDIRPALNEKAENGGIFSTPADVYTLNGVCIRRQATSTDGLPKGIYIVKGYKIVVR